MNTYFISGHLDLSGDEFLDNYILSIIYAVQEPGSSFVVGDARGTDTLAQHTLAKLMTPQGLLERVRVFHMFETPRNNPGSAPTVGGFTSDDERDAAMTAASTHDIAWVRPGREKSGTAKNLARRGKA
jgi:hypothetical protein